MISMENVSHAKKDEFILHLIHTLYERDLEIGRLRMAAGSTPDPCAHDEGYISQGPFQAVICRKCNQEL